MTTEELLEFLWQQAVSVGYDKGREAFASMESEAVEDLKKKLRAAEEERDALNVDLESMTVDRDLASEWEKRELGEARSNLQTAQADATNFRAAFTAMTKERDALRVELDNAQAEKDQRPPLDGTLVIEDDTTIVLKTRDGWNHIVFGPDGKPAKAPTAPCKCATGPWIPGKPEVMDGRQVLVRESDGRCWALNANAAFKDVTHHAEINRTEGGAE